MGIRDHKGRFSRKGFPEKISRLKESRENFKKRNTLFAASNADHPYAIPSSDRTDVQIVDTDFDPYIPPDIVPLSHCRFVVELDTLSTQLTCKKCEHNLYLHEAKGVRCYGLTGIVYIICNDCGELNRLKLGKVHYEKEKRGVGIFDVNTKAATGIIHAGIGETQLNNFLAALNIHCIDHKTLRDREDEAGVVFETRAEISEQKNLQEEIIQSTSEDVMDTGIGLSTDTCWQKKGSGRSYNSLSGVSTMIGKNTGKVINHKLRITSCRICDRAKARGVIPRVHKCRKNWSGSAKGMEPDMVVEMLKEFDDKDIKISEVVGDDDSTGFDRAKRIMPESNMVKISDKNHIKHSLISKLNELKHKHKELTGTVCDAIVKNFTYVINQNVGNPQGIREGLRVSVDHIFGYHDSCSESWCGFMKDDSYKHKNLPHGRDLSSDELRSDLEKLLVEKMGAQADKLSNLGSSQANESLNNIIAMKAPKAKHYSSSASLNYRVGAAVLQKNEGYNYVTEVNTSIGLSPGNETLIRGNKLNKKREDNKKRYSSKKGKRQRRLLKKKRLQKTTVAEVKEGKTYHSSIGLEDDETIQEELQEIPGIPADEKIPNLQEAPIVCFDLETTGLSKLI